MPNKTPIRNADGTRTVKKSSTSGPRGRFHADDFGKLLRQWNNSAVRADDDTGRGVLQHPSQSSVRTDSIGGGRRTVGEDDDATIERIEQQHEAASEAADDEYYEFIAEMEREVRRERGV
jgi:hypothetical protein